MNFLMGVLAKVATALLSKFTEWAWRALSFIIAKKKYDKKIDEQVIELKDAVKEAKSAVNEAKTDGVVSEDEEKRIREASRNLINGTFDK